MNLVEKYRPRKLADILGQPWVIHQLEKFIEQPYPVAFIFAGGTGAGKTSAAIVLASELGVAIEHDEMGGLHQIASGEQTGESVRSKMDLMRVSPWMGSGWRCLIVNEADAMTANAAHVWLDALEHLPPRCVVIFTTNHAHKLPARLRDRCELLGFDTSAMTAMPYCQELIDRVWKAEGRTEAGPQATDLPGMVDGQGEVSFRRTLQLLTLHMRGGNQPSAAPGSPKAPEARQRSLKQAKAAPAGTAGGPSFAERLLALLTGPLGIPAAKVVPEFARRIQVSDTEARRILSGRARPRRTTIVECAEALGVQPQELYPDLSHA
jgi:DNA polymerase III, delta subunit/Helix-turn-helix domain